MYTPFIQFNLSLFGYKINRQFYITVKLGCTGVNIFSYCVLKQIVGTRYNRIGFVISRPRDRQAILLSVDYIFSLCGKRLVYK